jgi:hypothetical protein
MVEHVACFVRKRDTMSARMSENTAAERMCRCAAGMTGAQERKERKKSEGKQNKHNRHSGVKGISAEKKRGDQFGAGRETAWLYPREL